MATTPRGTPASASAGRTSSPRAERTRTRSPVVDPEAVEVVGVGPGHQRRHQRGERGRRRSTELPRVVEAAARHQAQRVAVGLGMLERLGAAGSRPGEQGRSAAQVGGCAATPGTAPPVARRAAARPGARPTRRRAGRWGRWARRRSRRGGAGDERHHDPVVRGVGVRARPGSARRRPGPGARSPRPGRSALCDAEVGPERVGQLGRDHPVGPGEARARPASGPAG